MSGKIHLDSQKEIIQRIPDIIHVNTFLQARISEIEAFSVAISDRNSVRSVCQKLPHHMRRRAMSHSVKRVPRNLRAAHKRQLEKSGALKKSKTPRKKYRKRPKSRALDLARRSKNHGWLKTHVWHAKRFHMTSKWGYKLAERSCEKTFRCCYRSMSAKCLLQDISYYCCSELTGPLEMLLKGLERITNRECGLTFGAKCWLSGMREGSIPVFECDKYPRGAIGTVKFLWKPGSREQRKTLWIWSHPASQADLLGELIETFDLKKGERGAEFKNESVVLTCLKDSLARFRLTGPESGRTLAAALHSTNLISKSLVVGNEALNLLQNSFPSDFSPHCVYSDHVLDPRLLLKETKRQDEDKSPRVPLSDIWESKFRESSISNMLTNAELNKLRSKQLVPGHDYQLLDKVRTSIPVLFVQNPGSGSETKLGFGSGWEIIFPASWAMPMWMSLILCGAKAGGLRESETILFEGKNKLEFDPDSRYGRQHYQDLETAAKRRYFRSPPNKRLNYTKLGFRNAFTYCWDILTREWASFDVESERNLSDFYVVRRKRAVDEKAPPKDDKCLVPVIIECRGKGKLKPFSPLYLPVETDLKTQIEPLEKPHPDENVAVRKLLRDQHRERLKIARRARAKVYKSEISATGQRTLKKSSPSAFKEEMQALWLPDCHSVRYGCQRETLGYVVKGGFSFATSKMAGQGYVTSQGVTRVLEMCRAAKCPPTVLVRCSGLNYRFCTLKICN